MEPDAEPDSDVITKQKRDGLALDMEQFWHFDCLKVRGDYLLQKGEYTEALKHYLLAALLHLEMSHMPCWQCRVAMMEGRDHEGCAIA